MIKFTCPKISIIVPTFNRHLELPAALEALCCQQGIGDGAYEVIVVDNNSSDGTKATVEEFIGRYGPKVRYLRETKQGISYARNQGIGQAHGEIIAFTDDDACVDPFWVYHLEKAFESPEVDAMGGRVLPVYPSEIPEWVKKNQDVFCGAILQHDYGEDDVLYTVPPMLPFMGVNFAIRRRAFLKHGLFREDIGIGRGLLGEDTEMYWRLSSSGVKIYYCGKAMVHHPINQKRIKWNYYTRWSWEYGRFCGRMEKEKMAYSHYLRWVISPKSFIKFVSALGLNLLHLTFCFLFHRKRGLVKDWSTFFLRMGMFYEYHRP